MLQTPQHNHDQPDQPFATKASHSRFTYECYLCRCLESAAAGG